MFGHEHGCHLLQVEPISLLLQLGREEDGDDPLGDVGQVEVIVALHHSVHHPVHAEASVRRVTEKHRDEGEKRSTWVQMLWRG